MAEEHAPINRRDQRVAHVPAEGIAHLGERLTSYDAVSGLNERDEQPARMLAAHVGKRALLDARWLDCVSFRAGKNLASWMP